jgi:hypothetical protein
MIITIQATSNQDAFTKAFNGVVNQGGAAVDDSEYGGPPKCAYRGFDGKKCGIGHLISDEDYHEVIEGNGIADLLGDGDDPFYLGDDDEIPVEIEVDGDIDPKLLEALQTAHDRAYKMVPRDPREFVHQFKRQMSFVAGNFKLEYPQ